MSNQNPFEVLNSLNLTKETYQAITGEARRLMQVRNMANTTENYETAVREAALTFKIIL